MTIDDAAVTLARAFERGTLIAPLDEALVASDDQARALQAAALAQVDDRLVGWKIGATTAKAQAVMATSGPFYGPMLARRLVADGAELALPAGFRGFECEFALRLGADLPPRPGGYGEAQLAIAIDAVVPAIEVVATRQRVQGMGDARRATADFGFHHGLVLGAPVMPPPLTTLAAARVVARVEGVEVGRGSGADVLGHPVEALAWLTRQGVPLRAGDLVSTGTCTGLAALEAGQEAEGDFAALGRVTLRATAAPPKGA